MNVKLKNNFEKKQHSNEKQRGERRHIADE